MDRAEGMTLSSGSDELSGSYRSLIGGAPLALGKAGGAAGWRYNLGVSPGPQSFGVSGTKPSHHRNP